MAWLYKRPDSKKWWIGYMANGKQFLRSTKTADRKLAEAELAKVEALFRAHDAGVLEAAYQALSGKRQPKLTLKAALEDWLAEVNRSADAATHTRYEDIAEDFFNYLGATESRPLLSDVSSEHCRSYLNHRRSHCSASTTNLERKVLSVFFRRAIANEHLTFNPILAVKPFKAARGETAKRRAFSLAELELLYSKAPNDFWRYMIYGGFSTGLRLSDLVCLTWESIDLNAAVLHVNTRKTGKDVHIPLTRPFRSMLERLKALAKRNKGFIWPEQANAYEEKGSAQFSNEFYDEILGAVRICPATFDQAQTESRPEQSARSEPGKLSLLPALVCVTA